MDRKNRTFLKVYMCIDNKQTFVSSVQFRLCEIDEANI